MAKKKKRSLAGPIWLSIFGLAGFTALMAFLLRGKEVALLNPRGVIADEQFRLLIVSTSIMLVFAVIILFFLYFFAWKYRETDESDRKKEVNQNAGRNKLLIFTAWTSPIIIFIILAAIMLPATQRLEPQRSIESDTEEMTIRVIAMRWKWLFLYPEQDVATLNFVQIPVDTPVRFELTADEAPMQSFWIPNLGGMLYAMTEHVNPLNLMAHTIGDYSGGAAEINGTGFAGMRFTARVTSQADFDQWVNDISVESSVLDEAEYQRLLKPSEYDEIATYSSPTNNELFKTLIDKYSGSHSHYNEPINTEAGGHH